MNACVERETNFYAFLTLALNEDNGKLYAPNSFAASQNGIIKHWEEVYWAPGSIWVLQRRTVSLASTENRNHFLGLESVR
jgi:hypothetical protein